MNAFKQVLSGLTALSWLLFLFVDYYWQIVITKAVCDQNATYGELYGTLSFLRPIVLIAALVLTGAALCMLSFSKTSRN